tara:strand:+ start:279 stop:554 length:276 start_codon:yes stop_codon:yes gene_type:complete
MKRFKTFVTEGKSMVATDKKSRIKYTLHGSGQKIRYKGKTYDVDKVAQIQALFLKGPDKVNITKAELEKGFADGTIKVIDIGSNPNHKVKI